MEDLQGLYQKLLSLTEKQKEKIAEKDYDGLLEVLDNKDEVIDKIENISLEQYIKEQEKPEKKFNNIKETMNEIKELEDKNMEKVQQEQSEIKEKLKDINLKEKSRKGYQNLNSNYDAKFIDEKG